MKYFVFCSKAPRNIEIHEERKKIQFERMMMNDEGSANPPAKKKFYNCRHQKKKMNWNFQLLNRRSLLDYHYYYSVFSPCAFFRTPFAHLVHFFSSFCTLNGPHHELMLIIMIPIQSTRCNQKYPKDWSKREQKKLGGEQIQWMQRIYDIPIKWKMQAMMGKKCDRVPMRILFFDSSFFFFGCVSVAVGASYFFFFLFFSLLLLLLLFSHTFALSLWLNYRKRGKMISLRLT